MQRVLVLCATIVSFSTARGDDIREQVLINGAFIATSGVTTRSAAFSPDGKLLVTASTGGGLFCAGHAGTHFWDPATGKHLATLDDDDGKSVGVLAFTPNGQTLAGGTGREVCLWDVRTRKLTGRLKGSQYVSWMTFSPDGTMLATGHAGAGAVQIWGVKEEKVVAILKAAQVGGVRRLVFSGDGKSLAVGYGDGTILVWDIKTERETTRGYGRPQQDLVLAFEPGDRILLSVGVDRIVARYDLATRTSFAGIKLRGAAEPRQLAFGPDLATLAMVDVEGGLSVWDTKTGARVSKLEAKLHPGARVYAFSPDGKWIATEPNKDKVKSFLPPIQVWAVGSPADK